MDQHDTATAACAALLITIVLLAALWAATIVWIRADLARTHTFIGRHQHTSSVPAWRAER